MRALVALFIAAALLMSLQNTHAQDSIPRAAQQYRLTLKREAQWAWGLNPPVATFAAQIHQESRWRLDASSPVGAKGLGQVMPSTAAWLGDLFPSLSDVQPVNPTWSIRALVTYDKWLADRVQGIDDCQDMAFALSAYNGGLGWVYKRDQRSSQPGVCMGATCTINPGISAAAQAENEAYPRLILLRYEPLYETWGVGSC